MIAQVLALAGWTAALLATAGALIAWRTLAERMEAVARACHELRGPITATRLGLQLGSRNRELSAARLRAVDLELGRASLALDDLSRVGSPGRSVPAIGATDVSELLADSVEAWRATAARCGVGLVARWSGGPARVTGDRLRLAQATGNLIANAIEHGGGPVEVRGHLDAATVRFEVTDHGPGLPAPVAELSRRARGGRGARGRGLAIASEIAASHGGRLAAAPSDCGARLVLELPVASPGTSARAAPSWDG